MKKELQSSVPLLYNSFAKVEHTDRLRHEKNVCTKTEENYYGKFL